MVAERRPLVEGRSVFTEKMNAGFDDDELEFTAVDVEPNKQSNDPPPEFTGAKPSEFKSYRKKVKLWLLFTRTPAHLQGPRVFEQVDRTSLGCLRRGLEPEDVATVDGVNVILDTLAEAFQGEHETELFDALEDTFYGPSRKKGERPHDCALRVQSNVSRARSTVARPSTGISSVLSSEPEHSSSHRHHDTGR